MSSQVGYSSKDVPSPETEYDVEKNTADAVIAETNEVNSVEAGGVKKTGPLWRIVNSLSKYGVEDRGIERVLPHERTQTSVFGCFFMWFAANCTVSTFSLGTLGASIWKMGFRDAALTIIFFNLFGAIPVGLFSVWGTRTGMRQLALSRFGFGYWTVMIPTALNCIACIGWSTINSIAGGLVLKSTSIDSNLKSIPVAAAIVVIGSGTLIVSFMGYKIVHLYEKYSWWPVAIIFIIYAVQIGRVASAGDWGGSGEMEASSVLSFGAAVLGFAIGWTSLAADYSCKLPEDVSAVKVFALTYAGVALPCIFLQTLGAAAMTTFTQRPEWGVHFENEHLGGLIAAPLISTMGGFGRFCCVLLALSIIANNIPNIYSFSLTFQVLGPWAQRIPRPFLALGASCLYVGLAIAGANNFEAALDNLLLLLAYWLSVYCVILLEEHFIFRKGSFKNWDFTAINTPSKLPKGIAAFVSLCVGWVGAVLGMSTTFYTGVVAKTVGSPIFGTDFGFEMALAFAGLTYPVLRYYEKKRWGY